MARYGIIVDLTRCTGCMTCVLACKEENLTPPGTWWNKVLEIENQALDNIVYVRYACMHCEDAPCIKACPEGAISRRPDGIVLIDQEKCKAHGECIKACPYGVIELTPEQDYFEGEEVPLQIDAEPHRTHLPGKATKCTLCAHRIDVGKEPACVAGCPSRAMTFGDLDDPGSGINKKLWRAEPLLPSEGAHPCVFYVIPQNFSKTLEERVKQDPKMSRG